MKQLTSLSRRFSLSHILLFLLSVILTVGLTTATSEAKKHAVASWYGKQYHGRHTSSGVIYDMNSTQAAHKTLPFGTKLRVTNARNGKSTTVRITDRGPFVKSRDIDLSYKCAKDIGIVDSGVANVRIDYVCKDGSQTKYIDITDTSALPKKLEKTAFFDYKNAAFMKNMIKGPQKKYAYIKKSRVGDRSVYVVSTVRKNDMLAISKAFSNKPDMQSSGVILSTLKARINRSKAANMLAMMSAYGHQITPINKTFISHRVPFAYMPGGYVAKSHKGPASLRLHS
ncbi:MAG: septal ring lytic transglycosylase RlpA family protein [Nitrospirae bacterium]|nr:septal ring lytic transglycosylase RlpA family protein [Nitrospirota bacterium]